MKQSALQRPLIMGVLNTTPDSFSDGGKYNTIDAALKRIRYMIAEGVDIIDVGGESTRPGAKRVSVEEQLQRTIDIIAVCRSEVPERVDISIDTTRAKVAEAALDVGATMINDITAGTDDTEMFALAAERKVPICLMHIQGRPANMQDNPYYDDVVAEVRKHLLSCAELAMQKGVEKDCLILDPGIGFGKTVTHNLQLLAHLREFVDCEFPVLLGTSRKSFLHKCYDHNEQTDKQADDLVTATCATTVWGVQAGVRIFRVHDVQKNRIAADTAWAIARST